MGKAADAAGFETRALLRRIEQAAARLQAAAPKPAPAIPFTTAEQIAEAYQRAAYGVPRRDPNTCPHCSQPAETDLIDFGHACYHRVCVLQRRSQGLRV